MEPTNFAPQKISKKDLISNTWVHLYNFVLLLCSPSTFGLPCWWWIKTLEPSKLILCNGHVTLTLVNSLTWSFAYGFALVSPTSPFTFTIIVVDMFIKTKFWMQWITMVNGMTLNTTMLTFLITIWRCAFGCRCLTFVLGSPFSCARTFTSPTHNPLALFCWKWWGRPSLPPLLIPFGLPTIRHHWFFIFGIPLGGHDDIKFTNFHQKKSSIYPFHNVKCLSMWHDFHD